LQRYLFLLVATVLGFLGLGSVSMIFLVIAWLEARAGDGSELIEVHQEWIRKSAKIALLAHVILLGVMVAKASMVVLNGGEGWLQALIAHWFIDHIGEALISVWLLYRVIKGATSCRNNRFPVAVDDQFPTGENVG